MKSFTSATPLLIFAAANTHSGSAFAPSARRAICTPATSTTNNLFDAKSKTATVAEESINTIDILNNDEVGGGSFTFGDFVKDYPFSSNLIIASTKTAAADLLAQVVISHTPLASIQWDRTFLFFIFGAIYSGGFNYFYQVQVFKKLFDVDKFTSQPWADKLKDEEGLKSLAAQTAVDLVVLTLIYLPAFYVFKAGVFNGSMDPSVWANSGIHTWQQNFAKDEFDLMRVFFPADLICFSVPLYLRLPSRHIVSFIWTAYLSFSRGGH